MVEIFDNILNYIGVVDAVCVTTNGTIKKNGAGVMGAGNAKAFNNAFKDLDSILGRCIKENGNITQYIYKVANTKIIAFPVKHHWYEKADIDLIVKSYKELVNLLDLYALKSTLLPRPGCQNGGLDWKEVKAKLLPIWDERITIIYYT